MQHYLQGPFDSALGKVITQIVPRHRYMSVHDLVNPELFHQCLINTINNIPELGSIAEALNLPTIVRDGDSGFQSGFVEQRMHNFGTICQIMNEAFDALNVNISRIGKQALFRLVKHQDLDELQILIEQLFELLIRNREMVQFITTLGEEDQFYIKDFLQKARSRHEIQVQQDQLKNQHENEKIRLEEENAELRNLLISKQNQLNDAHHQILTLEDQISQYKILQADKEAHIQGLKRRLIAYQQTDSLFQEKDQQIFKLQRQLGELQIANRLLISQRKSEREKLESKVSQLQKTNFQLQIKCDKLINSYQILSRQRQDAQSSNKKVITNLRERIKNLTDRVNELQGQLVEAKIGRQLRQRQFTELMNNFQSLKSQSSDLMPQSKQHSLDKIIINSSSGQGKQFLRLQQQLNEIDKLKQNAFQEEIMMFESGQDNLRKVQEIIAQNARLKEKLLGQQNQGLKQLRDENQKLKKKLLVMKKRNDELQSQKIEEIQLIISAFDSLVKPN